MTSRLSKVSAMSGIAADQVDQELRARTGTVKKAAVVSAVITAGSEEASGGNKHPFPVILSKQQAINIYSMRSPDTTSDPALQVVAGKSSMVAEMYSVSPKTIRDIWNRKTWTQVTRGMWTEKEAEDYAIEQAQAKLPLAERLALKSELCKRRGRPPGSKDSRPRRRRIKGGDGLEHLMPSEGLMYVTVDGAVQLQPIPQAPPVSNVPVSVPTTVARPSVIVDDSPAQSSVDKTEADAHHHEEDADLAAEPTAEPGCNDDFFWSGDHEMHDALDDHEPGVEDERESEPFCPGYEDSEARPPALLGPVSDDNLEQQKQIIAERAVAGNGLTVKVKMEHEEAHTELMSMLEGASGLESQDCLSLSVTLDAISWLPDGCDHKKSLLDKADCHHHQSSSRLTERKVEDMSPTGPAGPPPARSHTFAPSGTFDRLGGTAADFFENVGSHDAQLSKNVMPSSPSDMEKCASPPNVPDEPDSIVFMMEDRKSGANALWSPVLDSSTPAQPVPAVQASHEEVVEEEGAWYFCVF